MSFKPNTKFISFTTAKRAYIFLEFLEIQHMLIMRIIPMGTSFGGYLYILREGQLNAIT